ncbi:Oidioi.mRNA.OKI2018_I69.PAR.g10588.t1.cds [Oikopleura dioica]|uniref:Oidioi.mRNA.OKI2018_I69.PAR.g10588.t1.cds n=1 Tax=Oikopleura dioica TaxID=34765 RepID=A0ABN7RUU2_OIKDI|nr:Oidioi.mRNA.OKI2018_I69.PAR.g10588.t1.cds [Oikopleura dioica]
MIFSLATDLDYLYFGVKGKERKNKNGEYVVPDVKKYREKVRFRQMQISKRYKVLRKKFLGEEKQVTETECQTDRKTSSVGSSQTIITNAILKGMIEKNEPVEVSGISTQTEVPESPFVQKPIGKTNFPSSTNARGRGRGRGRGGLYRPSSRLDSSNIGFDKMESEVKKPEKAGRPDSNIGNSSLVFEEALPEPEKTVQENPAAKKRLIRPKDEEFERYEPEIIERTFTSLDKFQRNPSSNAKPIPRKFKPYQQEPEIPNKENVPFCAKEEDVNEELPKVQAEKRKETASTVGARGDSTLFPSENSTVAPTSAVEENEDDLTDEEKEPRESSKDIETPDVKISSEKEMNDKKIDDCVREQQVAENNEEDLKSEKGEQDYVEEQKSSSSDSDRDDLTTEQKELMDDVNRVANMAPSEVDTDFSDEEIVPPPVQTQGGIVELSFTV